MIRRLRNLLRDGCAHDHVARPFCGRQRCLDCGRYRFHNFQQVGERWFLDRLPVRKAAA
jgi:hypothetical protein